MMKSWILAIVLLLFAVETQAATAILSWNSNTEADLQDYLLYKGTGQQCLATTPLPPHIVNNAPVVIAKNFNTFMDTIPDTNGLTVCYELTARDTMLNESAHSVRATKTLSIDVVPGPPGVPSGIGLTINVTITVNPPSQ